MKKLTLLVAVTACTTGNDLATFEQHAVDDSYESCWKDDKGKEICVRCWLSKEDIEYCEEPISFTDHGQVKPDAVVFETSEHALALWSPSDGWRPLSPTDGGADARGAGDFDGDGLREIVWERPDGTVMIARGAGSGLATGRRQYEPLAPKARLTHIADFDGDGADDLLWFDGARTLGITFGAEPDAAALVDAKLALGPAWTLAATGDFDGNGTADVVWRNDGEVQIWSMAGAERMADRGSGADATWALVGARDIDSDGRAELVWREASGAVRIWFGGDPARTSVCAFDPKATIETLHDLDGDGRADLLVRDADGRSTVLVFDGVTWKSTDDGVTHEDTWNART